MPAHYVAFAGHYDRPVGAEPFAEQVAKLLQLVSGVRRSAAMQLHSRRCVDDTRGLLKGGASHGA